MLACLERLAAHRMVVRVAREIDHDVHRRVGEQRLEVGVVLAAMGGTERGARLMVHIGGADQRDLGMSPDAGRIRLRDIPAADDPDAQGTARSEARGFHGRGAHRFRLHARTRSRDSSTSGRGS